MPRAIWSGSISFGLVNIPVKLFNAVSRKSVSFNQIDKRTFDALERYSWPGNIRELQNVIERALILSHGAILELENDLISVATSEASSSTCMGTAIAPDTASSRHAVRWSPFSIRSASSTTP